MTTEPIISREELHTLIAAAYPATFGADCAARRWFERVRPPTIHVWSVEEDGYLSAELRRHLNLGPEPTVVKVVD